MPFEAAPFGVTGLETAFAALYTHLVEPGLVPLETLLERMSAGPARIFGLERPADRGRRAREPRPARAPRRRWRVREDRFRSRSANSWLLGERLHGKVASPLTRRRRDGSAFEPAAVERMTPSVPGLGGRDASSAARASARRGRRAFGEAVFTTGDDRLPGGRHRPELLRADRLLHRADGRQLRRRRPTARESARPHARAVVMREARGPEWTDWLHERGIPALTGIDTRALVLHLRERGAMRAARRRPARTRSTRRCAAVREQPSMSGRGARAAASRRRSRTSTATRATCGSRSSTTAPSARSCAGSPAPARAVTVFPHDVDADTLAGFDGVLLSNGPGDPEPLVGRGRDRARAARPRAGARHLPRPPAARARDRPRAPTSCPFGHRGANHPVRRARDAAACSSRARTTASRSSASADRARHARVALRRHRRGRSPTRSCARARCSSIPRPGPGPHDAWPILGELGRGGARLPRRDDIQLDLPDRLRARS